MIYDDWKGFHTPEQRNETMVCDICEGVLVYLPGRDFRSITLARETERGRKLVFGNVIGQVLVHKQDFPEVKENE